VQTALRSSRHVELFRCSLKANCRPTDISRLNVHAPKEDKIDYVKNSSYEQLQCIFDKFPKCHMKILLGDFSTKVSRGDIFKPTIRNTSLHEISNDNGIKGSKLCNI
jgi:hypothetical protein